MSKPLITAFGASGAPGGGSARAMHPGMRGLAEWLAIHASRIAVAPKG